MPTLILEDMGVLGERLRATEQKQQFPLHNYQCTTCFHIWEQHGTTTCCPKCFGTNLSLHTTVDVESMAIE